MVGTLRCSGLDHSPGGGGLSQSLRLGDLLLVRPKSSGVVSVSRDWGSAADDISPKTHSCRGSCFYRFCGGGKQHMHGGYLHINVQILSKQTTPIPKCRGNGRKMVPNHVK